MQKLISLDQVSRFYYDSPRSNPYVIATAKYGQVFAEILGQAVDKITSRKVERREMASAGYQLLESLEKDCLKDEDSWMEGDHQAPNALEPNPEYYSQNFLSDFIDFLNNLVRTRVKSMNQAILP